MASRSSTPVPTGPLQVVPPSPAAEDSDNEQDQAAVASANIPIIALPLDAAAAAAPTPVEAMPVPVPGPTPARAMKQVIKGPRKMSLMEVGGGDGDKSDAESDSDSSSGEGSGSGSDSSGEEEDEDERGKHIVRVARGNESNDVEIDDDEDNIETVQTQLVSSPPFPASSSSAFMKAAQMPMPTMPVPMPMSMPVPMPMSMPVPLMSAAAAGPGADWSGLGGGGGAMETNLLHVSAGLANMTQILQTFMGGVAKATTDNAALIRKSIKQQKKAEKRADKRFKRMQKEMLLEMRRQGAQLEDLKSGLAMRASNMDWGLDNIMLRQELSKVLDFIARFGMDTRTGYVVAFPVIVSGEVCVAVSLHLLSYALTAMLPFATRGVKEFTLAGLRALMSLIKTESVKNANAQQFYNLFAVDEYTGLKARQASNNIQAWRVYKAAVFVRALQMATRSDSAKFLELEEEPSSLKWEGKRRMMFSQESVKYREMSGRMSWGHVVQEEVLALPQVRSFFDIVRANGGAAGSSGGGASSSSSSLSGSSSSADAHELEPPFHFCGLHKELTAPVLPHAELVRRYLRDQRREREREEAEQLMNDDRIDREYVGGRSVRKRKAASSPVRAPAPVPAAAASAPRTRARRAPPARPGKQPRLVPLQSHGLAQAIAAAKAQNDDGGDSDSGSSSGGSDSTGSSSEGEGNERAHAAAHDADDDEEALVPTSPAPAPVAAGGARSRRK